MKQLAISFVTMALLLCTSVNAGPPRFAVMSDIHFGNNKGKGPMVKVPQALKNIFNKGPLDALFIVGDLTQDGKEEEYDQLNAVFNDKTIVPEGIAVYFLMGNHDNHSENARAIYLNQLHQPLHQYIEIKGYPFITVSMTEKIVSGKPSMDYNTEAQTFLSDKLAEAAKKYVGKPIFVFFHVPPLNTCYGSTEGSWGSDILVPILKQYPQIIAFTGHSHMPIGDPRSIHQDKFTVVNDGSTTYSGVEKGEVSEGTHPEGYSDITEGIIVNVLKNGNIQMERWDTYRNEEILPKWVVKAPFDGSNFTYKNRNGLPAPSFKRKVQPIVSNIDSQSYTVTFPQATDNEVVHHYLVEVLEGEQVIASFRKFSQFYLNSQMPAELSQKLTELPEGKTLVVQVKAVDSYKNMSAPIISKPFFTSVSDTKPTARFAVLSDTHFGNSTSMTKVPQSLKVLFSKKPLVDAVFVVGDLTHRGKREEYEQLMSVFTDKSLIPEGVAIYFMMGNNHDNHDKTTGIEHYLEITKQPLHHYVDIKGFPFIAFSEGGSKLNEFNEEMKDWLAKTMADAATKYPGKPIFAFSHVSPENTCYGTLSSEGWGTDIFLPVYNQYPQTVVFGGHSHYPIGDPRSINQQVFTSINDGSSYYSEVAPGEVSMGIHPEGYGNVTEGLIVNVFPNSDIEIERWDTYRDKEIMPRWEIKAPHDGSRFRYKNYNGLPAPTFAASAKITGEQDSNSYKITFSQAADNDVVFRYFIELLDTAGKVVYSYTKFSQFYLNSDMLDELSHTFLDLPHGKTFIPRITAADSYNNLSKPLTGEVFTTPLQ